MLARNRSGWTLLEFIRTGEDAICDYSPVTGAFAIVRVNGLYLIGHNKYRQQWEFPAGGIGHGETPRQAATRELWEETHQHVKDLSFRGLFKVRKPGGILGYQAVFLGFQHALTPFIKDSHDEMDKIMLWDLKQEIGYMDACDLKMVEMSCL